MKPNYFEGVISDSLRRPIFGLARSGEVRVVIEGRSHKIVNPTTAEIIQYLELLATAVHGIQWDPDFDQKVLCVQDFLFAELAKHAV